MRPLKTMCSLFLKIAALGALFASCAHAATTMDSANRYAYGANIGWINFETNGVPKVNLDTNIWTDSGLGLISPSAGTTTTASFTDTNAPIRFYRVEAIRPLVP
jgi:hypothetical protein